MASYEEKICQAIQIMLNKKISDIPYDRTITARIAKCINKEEGNGETIISGDVNQNQNSTENPKTGISNLTAVLLSCLFITVTLFILSKKHNVFKKF